MKKNRCILFFLLLILIVVSSVSCADNDSPMTNFAVEKDEVPSIEQVLPKEADSEEETFPEDLEEDPPEITYVLNTNSRKFHKPFCRSVELMKPENYQETFATREEVLEMGYTPCGNCKP